MCECAACRAFLRHSFPPSHVRELDIRPESLPDDIGAAALAVWERGEQRAALALLYRGLLSRLVHAHGVPIRASSTEGDCLALAQSRLAAGSAQYAARLVSVGHGGVRRVVAGRRAPCRACAASSQTRSVARRGVVRRPGTLTVGI